MTNPSSGLSQPVRRVSPTSPNSAAITSSMLPIPMRRVIPDRRSGNEFPQLPQPVRRVSRTVQTNAASRPGLYQPVRRVPPDRHAGSELLWLSRTVQPMRRVVPRPPSNAASFSGFPELSKPMRRVIPPGLPHPVRRVPSCTPEQWARIFCFPEFCGELCSEQKQLTALTIGNEGIQIQWPSRAHTRKHEAALPPVLMFFL